MTSLTMNLRNQTAACTCMALVCIKLLNRPMLDLVHEGASQFGYANCGFLYHAMMVQFRRGRRKQPCTRWWVFAMAVGSLRKRLSTAADWPVSYCMRSLKPFTSRVRPHEVLVCAQTPNASSRPPAI
jgi:hypothetical protein